jgi:hypothetical protein
MWYTDEKGKPVNFLMVRQTWHAGLIGIVEIYNCAEPETLTYREVVNEHTSAHSCADSSDSYGSCKAL